MTTSPRILSAVLAATLGLALAGTLAPGATADAAPPTRSAVVTAPQHARLSPARRASIRSRQQQMIAAHRPAPTLPRAGVKTFTVNTIEDSTLADANGTTCVDTTSGKCSLRAAVDAADNLKKPVKIVLGAKTYMLSTASALDVSNPAGTLIVGKGATKTSIQGGGGGVIAEDGVGEPAMLQLVGVTITGGTATKGAGIHIDSTDTGSTLVLDGVKVSGNTASELGGGLYADDYARIYARNSTFVGNHAKSGSGLYTYWADIDLEKTSISANFSVHNNNGYGAGWFNLYGVVRMTGGSIDTNTAGDATDQGGGGGLLDEYGNVVLTGVSIKKNQAVGGGYGGGAYFYEDLVEIDHSTFTRNQVTNADSWGGGMVVDFGAQVDLHHVVMTGNKVADSTPTVQEGGGAIWIRGDAYGNELTIDQGSRITGSNASAIYAYLYEGQLDLTIDHSTLSGNTDTFLNGVGGTNGCGGAICIDGDTRAASHLHLTKATFSHNTSAGSTSGGAISVYNDTNSQGSMLVEHSTFSGNRTGTNGAGGALMVYNSGASSPSSVRLVGDVFSANSAGTAAMPGHGGAVSVIGTAALSDAGSRFVANKALGNGAYGGAIDNEADQSERLTRTVFTGNSAGAGESSGLGGAVYSENADGDSFTQVTMTGNKAGSEGGGFYGDSGAYDVRFDRSTVAGNTAGSGATRGRGGGVYVDDAALVVENSTFTGNTAVTDGATPGQGGAIWGSGSLLSVRYSTVSGNVAKAGGGIYAYALGGGLLASIVSGNRAVKGGPEQDCATTVPSAELHSLGGNVLGQRTCAVTITATDKVSGQPGLGPLKKNGGPTMTMAITKKSPAVGRASFLVPATDQRGAKRPSSRADAGAFELSSG